MINYFTGKEDISYVVLTHETLIFAQSINVFYFNPITIKYQYISPFIGSGYVVAKKYG